MYKTSYNSNNKAFIQIFAVSYHKKNELTQEKLPVLQLKET